MAVYWSDAKLLLIVICSGSTVGFTVPIESCIFGNTAAFSPSTPSALDTTTGQIVPADNRKQASDEILLCQIER
jgi:hypothetical protein